MLLKFKQVLASLQLTNGKLLLTVNKNIETEADINYTISQPLSILLIHPALQEFSEHPEQIYQVRIYKNFV